jgi:hypothetical protein
MNLVAALAIVSIPGIMWSVFLLRRATDWPMRLLTLLLGAMPLYQTVAAAIDTGLWQFAAASQVRVAVDLAINVLFLFSIFLLEFAMDKNRKAQVHLRVIESEVPAVREGSLAQTLGAARKPE